MGNFEITKREYDDLLEEHVQFNILVTALFNHFDVCGYTDSIRIKDDEDIIKLLDAMFPTRFDAVKRYLKEEENKRIQRLRESEAKRKEEEGSDEV